MCLLIAAFIGNVQLCKYNTFTLVAFVKCNQIQLRYSKHSCLLYRKINNRPLLKRLAFHPYICEIESSRCATYITYKHWITRKSLGHVARNPDVVACEKKESADHPTHPRSLINACCSLSGKYNCCTCYMQMLKFLTSLCN